MKKENKLQIKLIFLLFVNDYQLLIIFEIQRMKFEMYAKMNGTMKYFPA